MSADSRHAARLAAVQALYQMDVGGAGINDVFAEFESFWLGSEIEGDQYLPAEEAFFRDIVSGVVRVFGWLARHVAEDELRRVFNLGIGYVAVAPDPGEERVIGRIVRA